MRKKLALLMAVMHIALSFMTGCADKAPSKSNGGLIDDVTGQPTTYIVTFKYNYSSAPNGGVYKTKPVKPSNTVSAPAAPERDEYIFNGWYTNPSVTTEYDFSTAINESLTLFAGWDKKIQQIPTTYAVTFYYNYTNSPNDKGIYKLQQVESGAAVPSPGDDPSRTGYKFLGWSTNDKATTADYDFSTPITQNTQIYAVWQIKTYSVTFYYNYAGAENDGIFEQNTVDYNTAVTQPADPSRTGYTFLGWSTNNKATTADYDFSTAITQATELYAVWQKNAPPPPTTYSVTFYLNDGTTNTHDSKTVESGTAVTKPADPSRDGYTFLGWSANDKATTADYDFSTPITQNTQIYAVWQIKTYSVTFYLNDGTTATHDSKTVESGTAVMKPADPSRDGYTFLGWSTNKDSTTADYDFSTTITGATNLYAVWAIKTFAVTFYLNDGTTNTHDSKTVEHNTAVTQPTDPSRDGYTFLGWSTNNKATTADYSFGTPITQNTQIYAVWQKNAPPPPTTYSVTFYLNDGTTNTHDAKTVESGTAVTQPTDPSRTGYTFLGWSTNKNATTADYSFGTAVTGTTNLYAVWAIKTFAVTFYLNDGTTDTHDSKTVESGTAVTQPADPSRDGYTFLGWSTNDKATTADYDFGAPITQNTQIYAVWQIKTFAVTFYYNYDGADNDGIFEQNTVDYNTAVTQPTNPSRDGYTFLGWSTNKDSTTADYNFSATITQATELYAVWQKNAPPPPTTYSVTFYLNDGTTNTHDSKTVEHNTAVTQPADPSRTGYNCLGWSTNKNATTADYDFSSPITQNTQIYAVWQIKTYKVYFLANYSGSSSTVTATVNHGDTVSAPSSDPTRTGYRFAGWYTTSACDYMFDFDTPITAETRVYAAWTIKTFVITFYYNYDGAGNDGIFEQNTVNYNATVSAPSSKPARTGYSFTGWYNSESGGTALSTSTKVIKDLNYYAQWAVTNFTVEFMTNAADATAVFSTKTVPYGATVSAPSDSPKYSGYTFKGWFTTSSATTTFDFSKAIIADTQIFAGWEKESMNYVTSTTLSISEISGVDNNFIMGFDASEVYALENAGIKYYDWNGTEQDIFKTLAEAGVNTIRVRVWNYPYAAGKYGNGLNTTESYGYGGGNCTIEKAVEIGKRATKFGMKLMVDFHYSDFWADPDRQWTPKDWQGITTVSELATKIQTFTQECCQKLYDAGVKVGIVQIGNETNQGIAGLNYNNGSLNTTWNDSTASASWSNTGWSSACTLFNAGIAGAKKVFGSDAKYAVHFTAPEASTPKWAAQKLYNNGVSYDILTTSYYIYYGHGTLANLTTMLSEIKSSYGVDVMVGETSWAYTTSSGDSTGNTFQSGYTSTYGYAASAQGQANWIRAVIQAVVNGNGIGVCYWGGADVSLRQLGTSGSAAQTNGYTNYGCGWATANVKSYDTYKASAVKSAQGSAWENQAMFDFTNGKALESLKVFAMVKKTLWNNSH